MGKYDRQVAFTTRLINKYGLEDCTILRTDDSGYDPVNDVRIGEVIRSFYTSVCFVPWVNSEDIDWGTSNTSTEDEQQKFLIPGENAEFNPAPGDRIITSTVPIGSYNPDQSWWSIERVTHLAPDRNQQIVFLGVCTRGRESI